MSVAPPAPFPPSFPLTPLEPWIAARLGLAGQGLAGQGMARLTRPALEAWQLARLNETLALARGRSAYQARRLAGASQRLETLADVTLLPFTTAEDLRLHGQDMFTVAQGDIARMVTLPTSGTSGPPKRLGFTAQDLELTTDFFHHGMATFTRAGQRVLVLMPGDRPGSVGEQLAKGLARLAGGGAQCLQHGLVDDPERVLRRVEQEAVDVLVGLPVQVLSLARHARARLGRRLSAVLLSADRVPRAVSRAVEAAFGCPVFGHYGLTETGLGGGVECAARHGYHLREADLLFEVVDPATGQPLPDGQEGEVVLTTLTRQGMPLIRYRTGDAAAFLTEPCPCGTVLRRLGPVAGRLAERRTLVDGTVVSMARLDDALLGLPWLLDFRATLAGTPAASRLDLQLLAQGRQNEEFLPGRAAWQELQLALQPLGPRLPLGRVTLGRQQDASRWPPKRTLSDCRTACGATEDICSGSSRNCAVI